MLAIELKQGFSDYNPLTDDLSDSLYWKLALVVRPAKWLIRKRSIEDLKKILLLATKLLKEAASNGAQLSIEEEIQNSSLKNSVFSNCTYLYIVHQDIDLSNQQIQPVWSELFAIIALAYAGVLVSAAKHPEEKQKTIDKTGPWGDYKQLLEHAPLLGMESLSYARVEESDELRKLAKTKNLESANISRRERYEPIKRWLCCEYQALYDQWKAVDRALSVRNAAKLLVKKAPDDLLSILTTDDPAESFQGWIKQFRDGEMPNIEKLPPFQK